MKAHQLIKELRTNVAETILKAEELKKLNSTTLNFKQNAESWSVLECLEHLNLYGDYYLPAIEKALLSAKEFNNDYDFNSGLLGNYFAKSMLPKQGKITNKMNTFKDKNPVNSQLDITTIDRFIKQLQSFDNYLEMALKTNMHQLKIPVTITRLIRLNLGDIFRFNINHIKRHFFQINNILIAQQ